MKDWKWERENLGARTELFQFWFDFLLVLPEANSMPFI
jgi:hypothetical protein